MTTARKRILIVGGVAGGSSCAARARRLSETAVLFSNQDGHMVMRLSLELLKVR